MSAFPVVVIDIGKTVAKVTLCDSVGVAVARRERSNPKVRCDGVLSLDASGIEGWLREALKEFAAMVPVRTIVPVGHGAGAAIIRDGRLLFPPLDYEQSFPNNVRNSYAAERDPFVVTGSPALPDGLNLGAQLHYLEAARPDCLGEGAQILPWAQYWSWLLSGVAASEVSSLGCHTDLWHPFEAAPSALAVRRGWAARFAPLRPAGDMLGTLRPEWARRSGLSQAVEVRCGVHDTNAALLGARGFSEIGGKEATVLSTGTWFVAMRTPAADAHIDVATLRENQDCLVNIDVSGSAVPSARFMGGREIQLLLGEDGIQIDDPSLQDALIAAIPQVIASGAMILPTMAPGVGPFPEGCGCWLYRPTSPIARAAAVALYAALVADASLDLIGARERLLVEGRFSRAEAFTRALASLRGPANVWVAWGDLDLAYGACRLVDERLPPPCGLNKVQPLDADMAQYRARWRDHAAASEFAA